MSTTPAKLHVFSEGPFTMGHPSPMELDREVYGSVLEYVVTQQHRVLFGPDHRLFLAGNCEQDLLQRYRNFNDAASAERQAVWKLLVRDVLMRANLAKFTDDLKMRAQLMLTDSALLVFADPVDTDFGAHQSTEDGTTPMWVGNNWLGDGLTALRQHLTVLTCSTTGHDELPTGFLHE